MKRFHYVYISAIMALLCLVACQQDDEVSGIKDGSGFATVTLRISTADAAPATRAWNDDNALADRSEMMYNWTVLLVKDGQVTNVFHKDAVDEAKAEIDDVYQGPLAAGTYTAYSFANISEASLKTILGVETLEGATLSNVEQKTVSIDANLKTTTDITADNAFGLGSKGIPMSNRQTITVEGTADEANPQIIDLIVVRMVAKLEFVFFNATKSNGGGEGEDLTVKSVSISDITQGTADNLKLLPNHTTAAYADSMTFHHGDIKPNLSTSVTAAEVKYTYPAATPLAVASTDVYDISKLPGNSGHSAYAKKLVFYVNETQLATGKQFELNVELNNGDYRYALVSTGTDAGLTVTKDPANPGGNENATTTPVTATERSDDWTYIARNDYRVIPIVLDNYRLELVPYDFPAIGVYPASVKTIDANTNLHEILFHDYGHFHLVPHVYRGKAWIGTEGTDPFPWEGKDINFSATQGDFTSTVWTLDKAGAAAAATDWTQAFTSFATTGTYPNLAKGDELTIALNRGTVKFYGAPGLTGLPADNVWPTVLPVYMTNFDAEVSHTKDSKTYSQGDFPMLDTETKWKPKSTDSYRPFIFGQIAPQDDRADKTVYHEFRVNLYVQGESVARQLYYRFYMHIKQDYGLSRMRTPRLSCSVHH